MGLNHVAAMLTPQSIKRFVFPGLNLIFNSFTVRLSGVNLLLLLLFFFLQNGVVRLELIHVGPG